MRIINIHSDSIPSKNYVYVGRPSASSPSKYGNPWVIGKDGSREDVIHAYKLWAWENLKKGIWNVDEFISDLNGKVLGCFCAPKPCHAEVLVNLVKYCCEKRGVEFIEAPAASDGDQPAKKSSDVALGMGMRAHEKYRNGLTSFAKYLPEEGKVCNERPMAVFHGY